MSKELIFVIIGFGVAVVAAGIYLFLVSGKSREKSAPQVQKISIDELLERAKNQSSTKAVLQEACELLISEHEMDEGMKEKFFMMVFLIAKHKNADSKLILNLQKELKSKSPQYAKEIERYGKAGLDER